MSAHKCPVCHLLFRFSTELDSHTRDEHTTAGHRRPVGTRSRTPEPAHRQSGRIAVKAS